MTGEEQKPDLVLILPGLAGILVSLSALPLVFLRPNRVSSGIGYQLAEILPGLRWLILGFSLLIVLVSAFSGRLPREEKASAARNSIGFSLLLSASLLLGVLVLLPSMTSKALAAAAGLTGRLSLASGFWVYAASVFVLIAGTLPFFGKASVRIRTSLGAGSAVLLLIILFSGGMDGLSLLKEFELRRTTFLVEFARHVAYAFFPSLAALFIAVPLGRLSARNAAWDRPFFFVANIAQVIPTLALIGFLIGPLSSIGSTMPGLGIRGTGWAPASIALFLYAFLPLLANAKAGFQMVEPAVLDVAKSMGMGSMLIFLRIELPLAAAAITSGFRTAVAQNMGNAILAGLVGGGGLGSLIFLGLAQAAPDLVVLGALAVAASAYGADRLFAMVERGLAAIIGHTHRSER